MKTFMALFTTCLLIVCVENGRAESQGDLKQSVKAPKGGDIKALREGYIEVVSSRSAVQIYLYDGNLKPQKQLKDFSVVAEVQRANSKDHENLELKSAPGGFTANIEPSEAAKYYLDIGIANRKSGFADRTSFDVITTPEQTTAAQ